MPSSRQSRANANSPSRTSRRGGHVGSVGEALQRAVESYNRSVGSLESRVLVQARRLEDLDAAGGERPVATPELPPGDDDRRGT